MSSKGCDYSPLECDIIKQQIARRAKYREEFLRKKSDPCAHSKEAGYINLWLDYVLLGVALSSPSFARLVSKAFGLTKSHSNRTCVQSAKNALAMAHVTNFREKFDEALQRFVSMKGTQLDHFQQNTRTSMFGICAIILPMVVYGTLIYKQRSSKEEQIRNGTLKYKDRIHKLV